MLALLFSCNRENRHTDVNVEDSPQYKYAEKLLDNYFNKAYTNYEEANDSLAYLLQAIDTLLVTDTVSALNFWNRLLQVERYGNINFADSLSARMVILAKNINNTAAKIDVNAARAFFFWEKLEFDSAVFYFQRIGDIVINDTAYDHLIVPVKVNIAAIKANEKNYDEALKTYEEILILAKEKEMDESIADIYNNLGILYNERGELFNAINCYNKSIEYYRKVNDQSDFASPIVNSANIYKSLGMDSLALEYYLQVREHYKNGSQHEVYSNTELGIVGLYVKNEQYDKAFEHANYLLAYLSKFKSQVPAYLAKLYEWFAELYMQTGEINEAKKYAKMAIHISDSLNIKEKIIDYHKMLAALYMLEEKYDSAIILAEPLVELIQKQDRIIYWVNICNILAKSYMETGNKNKALHYYEIYREKSKVYQDTIASQQIKDLAYFSELQKKDSEKSKLENANKIQTLQVESQNDIISGQRKIIALSIALLLVSVISVLIVVLQIRKKNRLNAILKDDNEFKNSLISVISHDLRSPVISLYNGFKLLADGDPTEEVWKKLRNELDEKTERAIDMIDNLLFWTRQQMTGQNIDKESFDARELVDEIINNELCNRVAEKLNITNELPENYRVSANKNIVHLVLRNLITNAVKFTPIHGTISIGATDDDTNIIFSVQDNGKGISENNKLNLLNTESHISTKGLRGEKGKGFRLKLCQYFIQKCGGKMWFESEEGKGSTFYFSFPK